MQTFKIVVTIAFALFLQLLLTYYVSFFNRVDLPLLVTVYFGLQRAPVLGMVTGLAAGIGGDAVAGGVLGAGGFSKTLIGYLIAIVSIKLSLENPLVRLGVTAVASAANTLLFAGLYKIIEQPLYYTESWGELGRTVGWKALADTVVAVFLFIVLDRVFSEQAAVRRMAIRRRFYE